MNEMVATSHLETELKYEVRADIQLPVTLCAGGAEPSAGGVNAEGGLACDSDSVKLQHHSSDVYELAAHYYDTAQRELAKNGIALRLRKGGADEGWHLKRRVDERTQHETTWPYEQQLPAAVAATVDEIIAEASSRLEVIAAITTTRTVHRIADDAGRIVAEICDDRVKSVDNNTGIKRAWREWEAELVETETGEVSESLLKTLDSLLITAGATPSLADSKIGRAVGALLPASLKNGASPANISALTLLETADILQAESPADPRIDRIRTIIERVRNMRG